MPNVDLQIIVRLIECLLCVNRTFDRRRCHHLHEEITVDLLAINGIISVERDLQTLQMQFNWSIKKKMYTSTIVQME